jgi:hypothetical protein
MTLSAIGSKFKPYENRGTDIQISAANLPEVVSWMDDLYTNHGISISISNLSVIRGYVVFTSSNAPTTNLIVAHLKSNRILFTLSCYCEGVKELRRNRPDPFTEHMKEHLKSLKPN